MSILGEKRARPAVPFGGKYRIIDFPLSNAVNSELYRVAVLTQYRPHSLMEHLGIGEPWDLDRSRPNGLHIWQPYRGRRDQDWYRGTADALFQNRNFLAEDNSGLLLLILSGDHIYKQDYRDLIRFQQDNQADLTVAVMEVLPEEVHRPGIMSVDADQRITQFTEKPGQYSIGRTAARQVRSIWRARQQSDLERVHYSGHRHQQHLVARCTGRTRRDPARLGQHDRYDD